MTHLIAFVAGWPPSGTVIHRVYATLIIRSVVLYCMNRRHHKVLGVLEELIGNDLLQMVGCLGTLLHG